MSQHDSETVVLSLKRISAVVETEATENKDWLQFLLLSRDQHPSSTVSGEEEKVTLISHVIEFIDVIKYDFGMMKKHLEKEDPKTASDGVINSRLFVGKSRSRMLQVIDELVVKKLRGQKAEDLHLMIYMAR